MFLVHLVTLESGLTDAKPACEAVILYRIIFLPTFSGGEFKNRRLDWSSNMCTKGFHSKEHLQLIE